MSRRNAATASEKIAVLFALGCMLLFVVSNAAAQNACAKDEIFGGYSYLIPNGWEELNYKASNIPNAFDASNTYYLPNEHNLGLVLLIPGRRVLRKDRTRPTYENDASGFAQVGEDMVDLSGIEPLASSLRILPPLEDGATRKNRK